MNDLIKLSYGGTSPEEDIPGSTKSLPLSGDGSNLHQGWGDIQQKCFEDTRFDYAGNPIVSTGLPIPTEDQINAWKQIVAASIEQTHQENG